MTQLALAFEPVLYSLMTLSSLHIVGVRGGVTAGSPPFSETSRKLVPDYMAYKARSAKLVNEALAKRHEAVSVGTIFTISNMIAMAVCVVLARLDNTQTLQPT